MKFTSSIIDGKIEYFRGVPRLNLIYFSQMEKPFEFGTRSHSQDSLRFSCTVALVAIVIRQCLAK
jgi:hypothetical protein